jgi:hypothetical protein
MKLPWLVGYVDLFGRKKDVSFPKKGHLTRTEREISSLGIAPRSCQAALCALRSARKCNAANMVNF